jgi:hypothetical protein
MVYCADPFHTPDAPSLAPWLATIYWCPRCNVQSERRWHFCEKGPPLIPQMDVETECDVIVVEVDAATPADQLAERVRVLEAGLRYIAGFDVAGYDARQRSEDVATSLLSSPDTRDSDDD